MDIIEFLFCLAFPFILFGVTWLWFYLSMVFTNSLVNVMENTPQPKPAKKKPVTIQPPVVKKEETKSNRWDWQEYRRHSRDEAFVESSMWLSIGDD